MNADEIQQLPFSVLDVTPALLPGPDALISVSEVPSSYEYPPRYLVRVNLLYEVHGVVTTQFYSDSVVTTSGVRAMYDIPASVAAHKFSTEWADTVKRVFSSGSTGIAACCLPDETENNTLTQQHVCLLTTDELSTALAIMCAANS